jgi:hypothetical protein
LDNREFDQNSLLCIYNSDNCRALSIKDCIGKQCPFYRSPESIEKSREQWKMRLLSLPDERQSEIAKKYYGGNMPWKNSGND